MIGILNSKSRGLPRPFELEELKAGKYLVSSWASKDVIVYPIIGWKTEFFSFWSNKDSSNLLEILSL